MICQTHDFRFARRIDIQKLIVVLAVVVTAVSNGRAADTVTRKSDGKKFGGNVTSITRTEFTVKRTVGEPQEIAANDVAFIEWDGATAEFRLALSDENAGNFDMALQRFGKSKSDVKNPSDGLKAEYEYVIARTTARYALVDSTRQDEAIEKIQSAQKVYPQHFRYFELLMFLGQVQLAKGDFEGARATAQLLSEAPWGDYQLAARIANGRVLVAEKKYEEATKVFEEAATSAGKSSSERLRYFEALIQQARVLVLQSRHEEAIKIAETVTDTGPADDAPLQAEAYVILGNSLQALSRPKEAVLAYLHVDLLYPKQGDFRAEALFRLVKAWKAVQQPDRSSEAESRLVQNYPNSAWRKKLAAGEASE